MVVLCMVTYAGKCVVHISENHANMDGESRKGMMWVGPGRGGRKTLFLDTI